MGDSSEVKSEHGSRYSFQSKDLEELLDVIDSLRLQGITGFIDLPQLIVCGDQSSGKSSVLEALCGVSFPTKDNLCTRYPTELILRRKPQTSTVITIVPNANRSDKEKLELQKFRAGDEALDDFAATVEAAGKVMGLEDDTRAFSTDVLRVELTGPTMPHLTVVDLPGLFHSGNKSQSDDDAEVVLDMVTGYMQNKRSIILAVVSAKNDYANQVVTKHARAVDPDGKRTLGIITKPDLLDEGSFSEKQYLEMAENKDVVLRLGWHVLKNRDFKERNSSLAERNRAEAKFFAKGIWTSLGPSRLGIDSLKSRLSRVLRDHILAELPDLTKEVEDGIRQCESRLEHLGASRATIQEQRRYLHRIGQDFSKIIQDGIAGYYNDEYFDESSSSSYPKRVRAVVANLLEAFATDMRINGRKYIVTGNPRSVPTSGNADRKSPIKITREKRLEHVEILLKQTRGRELPGFVKFETITTLFKEQCQPWNDIVQSYGNEIFEKVRDAILLALDFTSDQATKEGILQYIINHNLDSIKNNLQREISKNLLQHTKGHPITFNHYFTDNVQKLRNEHQADFLRTKVQAVFSPIAQVSPDQAIERTFKVNDLVTGLTNHTEADMNKYACSEALHYMEAYYKVALKFFVDDFSIHTIEQGLIGKLGDIFSQDNVFALTDDDVEAIAGEGEGSRVERASSSAKLAALKEAFRLLRQLDRGQSKLRASSA